MVTDPLICDILQRDYDRYSDVNLGGRPDLIEAVVGGPRFTTLCHEVRTRSEALLRAEPDFTTRFEHARSTAVQTLAAQQARLNRRHRALELLGETDPSVTRRRGVAEALRQAVTVPHLRLEAIGAFIVSHDRPDPTA